LDYVKIQGIYLNSAKGNTQMKNVLQATPMHFDTCIGWKPSF